MKERILIVEDEKEICNDLVKILQLSEYETIHAYNGIDGYRLACKHLPDLIISDIMIPGFNGYELLSKLQEKPETSAIPFLFLSAKSNKFDLREAMNLGADDFITKPFDIDELLNTIRIRLEKKQRRELHLTKKIETLQTNLRKTMPHEVRTPLNVILGFSEFLMKNNNITKEKDLLDMIKNIHESGQRLQRTFENYLLYANLELINASQREKNKFQKYKTHMADIYLRDISIAKATEFNRENDLVFDLVDATVLIYEEHFKKIAHELLDNSFKFSESGTMVKLTSTLTDNFLSIVITDHGRGMTEVQLQKLEEFVQFDRNTYEQQGTGLGLSIVKKIVDIYQGAFSIRSKQDSYTEVEIKIPGFGGNEI